MIKSAELNTYNQLTSDQQKNMWDCLNQGRVSYQHLPFFSSVDLDRVTQIRESYRYAFLLSNPRGSFRLPLDLDQASDDIDKGYSSYSLIAEVNVPLVVTIAKNFSSRANHSNGLDWDDLLTFGKYGLLQAIDRYDPDQQIPFGAYARRRIRGAILDGVQSASTQSRDALKLRYQAQEFEMEFVSENERFPSMKEFIIALGLSDKDIDKITYLFGNGTHSLNRKLVEDESESSFEDLQVSNYGLEDRLQIFPDILAIRELLDSDFLSERERIVILGLFFKDQTGGELAAELGVSQTRISQYRQQALDKLIRALND